MTSGLRFFITFVSIILVGCNQPTIAPDHVQPARPKFSDEVEKYIVVDSPSFALIGVTVYDGSGKDARVNQTILVSGQRITAVGSADSIRVPELFEVMDLSGQTVIPGFVGMHNHTHRPGSVFERYAASRLYLAGGVTTIQTTGSADPIGELALARAIDAGQEPGPRIFPTSPYITGPGGNAPPMTIPQTEAAARLFVQQWAERGATWIKIYRHVEPSIAAAVIDEAHLNGLKVTGHLCSLTFREAALMGIDSIEHGLLSMSDLVAGKPSGECVRNAESINQVDLSSDAISHLIDLLVEQNVTLTSTLAIMESHFPHRPQGDERSLAVLSPGEVDSYNLRQIQLAESAESSRYQPPLFAKIMQFERMFVAAGGHLVAGPDMGRHIVPGFGDQRNFELLIEAGFSVTETIKIMTSNGALGLGIADSLGFVRKGFQADLIVIDGDLEFNSSVIRNVKIVFKGGIGFDPALLINDVKGKVGLG